MNNEREEVSCTKEIGDDSDVSTTRPSRQFVRSRGPGSAFVAAAIFAAVGAQPAEASGNFQNPPVLYESSRGRQEFEFEGSIPARVKGEYLVTAITLCDELTLSIPKSLILRKYRHLLTEDTKIIITYLNGIIDRKNGRMLEGTVKIAPLE